jgi:RluA family pseudouridine synthase
VIPDLPQAARTIKLSSPATREFWELSVLYEDQYLLAIDKPSGLATSPDRYNPDRPSLLKLLHAGIAEAKPWARERNLAYLMNAHRLDEETSGIILLAKSKPVLVELVDLFGAEKPCKKYLALVRGSPLETRFEVEAKIAPHPAKIGLFHVNPKLGKRATTRFGVVEKFSQVALMECEPLTDRTHQIRIHLKYAQLPLVGDQLYGGKPLLLSRIKPVYRLKPQQSERPLLARAALHLQEMTLQHPMTHNLLNINAPCPKDLTVALKYLRKYAAN